MKGRDGQRFETGTYDHKGAIRGKAIYKRGHRFRVGRGCENEVSAPKFLQGLGGRSGIGIEIFVSAQFLGQRFLVGAAPDGDGAKAHLAGVLNSEMAETADALDRDQVSGARSGIAQRVVNGNAGA